MMSLLRPDAAILVKEVFWQRGLLSQKMLNPIVWLVVTRQKSSAIENEYTQMETEELSIRLLKGYAVADCYQYPECRDFTDNVQVVQDLKTDKKGVSNDTLKNETLNGIYQ